MGSGYDAISKGRGIKVVVVLGNWGRGYQEIVNNIPAPVTEWRPWTQPTVEMRTGTEAASIHGKMVLFSACWEDILIGNILDEMNGKPSKSSTDHG